MEIVSEGPGNAGRERRRKQENEVSIKLELKGESESRKWRGKPSESEQKTGDWRKKKRKGERARSQKRILFSDCVWEEEGKGCWGGGGGTISACRKCVTGSGDCQERRQSVMLSAAASPAF